MKFHIFLYCVLTSCVTFLNALYADPVIESLSPNFGPVAGGTSVQITGSGFTGITQVTFDDLPATNVTVIDDKHLQATTPTGVPGTISVVVTAESGISSDTRASLYTYRGDWIVYILNSGNNTVLAYNPMEGFGDIITLDATPTAIAITPNGRKAYVATSGSSENDIAVIDLTTNNVYTTIATSSTPSSVAITPDGRIAFVTDETGGTVLQIDTATDSIINTIPLLPGLTSLAITPNGNKAYVSNNIQNTVTPIDLRAIAPTPKTPITLGDGALPNAIAISPDGTTVYVVNEGAGSIARIDTALDEIKGSPIPVVSTPQSIAITPDGSQAFVAGGIGLCSGLVTAINLSTLQTQTISSGIGNCPVSVFASPDSAVVIATNSIDNTISTIDTQSNNASVISLPGLSSPVAIVVSPDQTPLAAFTQGKAQAQSPTIFDASTSLTGVGSIANYAWDFGDGQTLSTKNPVVNHTYTKPGAYSVTLTVINSANTSFFQTFTGQNVGNNGGTSSSKRNDTSYAILTQTIQVLNLDPSPQPPPLAPLHFKGKVIKKKGKYIHELSWKPSSDPTVIGYQLVRNGRLLRAFPAQGPFTYKDRHFKKHKKATYILVSINALGLKSAPVSVKVPK